MRQVDEQTDGQADIRLDKQTDVHTDRLVNIQIHSQADGLIGSI